MMEISVMCDMCKKKLASHVCKICGMRVCDDDFDMKKGVCIGCSRGRMA